MYSASDYRGMARRALKNYWWLAVGVTLLASILGGTSSSFTPSFSLTINGDDLTQYYPEALRHALQVFLPVSGVISLVQFVIGGSVSIGHNRFCLKLVDGEQAQFEDLFSGFDIFGNAFVLNLLITLKVAAVCHSRHRRRLPLLHGDVHHGRKSGHAGHGGHRALQGAHGRAQGRPVLP